MGAETSGLSRGRCTRRSLRKLGARGQNRVLRQRQGSDRLQQVHERRDYELGRSLVSQMAIGATSVIVRALVMPIADHTRSEDQQRDERQGDSEDAKRIAHDMLGRTTPGGDSLG
jgi:hypothetical protein